jgi:hypothetical protein
MAKFSPSLVPALLLTVAVHASTANADDGLVVTSKDGSDGAAEVVVDDSAVPDEHEAALKLFVGSWKCSGTSSTEYGAEVPTTFSWTAKKELGGRWIVVRSELTPKAKGAKAITSEEIWGFSRVRSTFVRSGATSAGGFLSTTSSGWAGERFAWTGDSSQRAKPAKEKLAFERKSDKELGVELSLGIDELHVVFEGTCRR